MIALTAGRIGKVMRTQRKKTFGGGERLVSVQNKPDLAPLVSDRAAAYWNVTSSNQAAPVLWPLCRFIRADAVPAGALPVTESCFHVPCHAVPNDEVLVQTQAP